MSDTDTQASKPQWLEYIYRTAHPVLCWLPTKLAEWIGENLQDMLGFPDKADQRAEPGTGWTPAELNHILTAHVVDGALTTFGCVQWKSHIGGSKCTLMAHYAHHAHFSKLAIPPKTNFRVSIQKRGGWNKNI